MHAAAGAIRIGNIIGAAFSNRRVIESIETRIMVAGSMGSLILAVLNAIFPRFFGYPFAVLLAWIAVVLFYRGYKLHHKGKQERSAASE